LLSAVLSTLAANPPSELEVNAPANLVQPRRLERLIDVAALALHGLGDRSGAHSFLA
jgi:hypothetical protein